MRQIVDSGRRLFVATGCPATLVPQLLRSGASMSGILPGLAENLPWRQPDVPTLAEGLRYALAYADVFDCPVTLAEAHRYAVGVRATQEEVKAELDLGLRAGYWQCDGGYYVLPGRKAIIETRRRRERHAAAMWERALVYAHSISQLPFVRMVALTGALPMGNVEQGADYDFMVITTEERVWTTRLLIVQLVVRPAARQGQEVCPNYLLAESALELERRDLFHAHELAQMLPLYGRACYDRLRAANAWASVFLPNADGPPTVGWAAPAMPVDGPSLLGLALRTRLGRWVERAEMRRMGAKLRAMSTSDEVQVSPLRCKGHLDGHAQRTREAFALRVQQLG